MHRRSDIIYLYDGSFEGLLCCIYESYAKKEIPMDIQPENSDQMTLYERRLIDTDIAKANRVRDGIKRKASQDVYDYAEYAYYTCHSKKELMILDFIRLSMNYGRNIVFMLTNDTVKALFNAVQSLNREAHQLKGFVRFSIYGELMLSVIEPKNFVLPLLASHFCDRYANETFMIYDKTHGEALIYQSGKCDIVRVYDFRMPDAEEEEFRYRCLWKLFYDTIAIEGRYNPECRRSHMQKRFWKNLTEMNEKTIVYATAKKTERIYLTGDSMEAIEDK